MAKATNQLKISKPDGTSHLAPLGQLKNLLHQNSILKANEKWTIAEVDENEKVLKTHTASELVVAKEAASAKDDEIAELKKQLAEAQAGKTADVKPLTAEEAIAKINEATTAEEVDAITNNDTRKSVVAAGLKKIAELNK